jgi:capsular polysaccharide biosynthesis protein
MENDRKNDEVEIDLREIFGLLLNKAGVIILTAILGAVIAFAFTKLLITPMYQSSTQIYVMNNKSDTSQITVTDLQSSSYLTKDYMILVTSRPVLEQVIADMQLDMTTGELAGKISVTTPTDTRILTITVTDSDPILAKNIADSVREASKTQIQSVLDVETVNTVEEANLSETPVSPNLKKNIFIGFLLGFILAVAVVIIRFVLDDTIKTQDDIEKYLGMSVLGIIPAIETGEQTKKKKKK